MKYPRSKRYANWVFLLKGEIKALPTGIEPVTLRLTAARSAC